MKGKDREIAQALLTTALFAVRLFKAPAEFDTASLTQEHRAAIKADEAMLRAEASERSALDAKAILDACDKIGP